MRFFSICEVFKYVLGCLYVVVLLFNFLVVNLSELYWIRVFLILFSFVFGNNIVKEEMLLFMCEIFDDVVGILLFVIMGGGVFVSELMGLLLVDNMVGKLLLLLLEVYLIIFL